MALANSPPVGTTQILHGLDKYDDQWAVVRVGRGTMLIRYAGNMLMAKLPGECIVNWTPTGPIISRIVSRSDDPVP